MNRILLGVLAGLLLVAAGLFWWQGRADTQVGKALPTLAAANGDALAPLPSGDPDGRIGVAPPEASEVTREMRRFNRFDRDRDSRISRNEMLAPRAAAFRKLDVNHDNLLTFDEWAVKTETKFQTADANRDGWLSRAEYATTKPKPKAKPACRCTPLPRGARAAAVAEEHDDSGDDGEPTH